MKLYKFTAVCTRTRRYEEDNTDTVELITRDFLNFELVGIRDALKPDIRDKVLFTRDNHGGPAYSNYRPGVYHQPAVGAPSILVIEDGVKIASALSGVLMSLGIDYKVSVTEFDNISNAKSPKEIEREKEEEEKASF